MRYYIYLDKPFLRTILGSIGELDFDIDVIEYSVIITINLRLILVSRMEIIVRYLRILKKAKIKREVLIVKK